MTDVITTNETHTVVTENDSVVVVETKSDSVLVAEGTSGPQGTPGPAGADGLDSDKSFSQQFTGSDVTVTHNLGKYPSVTVMTSAGDEVEGAVDHLSVNQLQISFGFSFSGTVICN